MRPRIRIAKSKGALYLELLTALIVLLTLALAFWGYETIRSDIPIHFGIDGLPDRYGSPSSIWMIPFIQGLLAGSVWYLSHFPHLFNYLEEITPDNAEHQYRMAQRLLRLVNFSVALIFLAIQMGTIRTALGIQEGLGPAFTPIFMSLLMGPILYYVYRSQRRAK